MKASQREQSARAEDASHCHGPNGEERVAARNTMEEIRHRMMAISWVR